MRCEVLEPRRGRKNSPMCWAPTGAVARVSTRPSGGTFGAPRYILETFRAACYWDFEKAWWLRFTFSVLSFTFLFCFLRFIKFFVLLLAGFDCRFSSVKTCSMFSNCTWLVCWKLCWLFGFVAGVLWLLILNLNLGIGMDFHFVRLSALPYERKTHN